MYEFYWKFLSLSSGEKNPLRFDVTTIGLVAAFFGTPCTV